MIEHTIDALATYRLTRLVGKDKITEPLRERLLVAAHAGGRNQELAASLKTLISCPWCASWWIGLGVVIARRACPRAWDPVACALAFSAVTGLLAQHDGS